MADTAPSSYVYGTIALGIVGFLMALNGSNLTFGSIFSVLGGLLTGLSAVLGVLVVKYDYILLQLVTQKTKTINMPELGSYEISPSQDTIVKNIGTNYYASAFLGIEVFRSPTEEPREENLKYNEFFERAVSSLRHVTKIGYLIQVEDISKKRREIEAKRAEAQLKLSKERQKPLDKEGKQRMAIDLCEKEFEVWDKQLVKISKGKKPMGVFAYAMVTASSVSKDGAVSNARSYAEEVKIAVANSLNVDVRVLNGDEMLKCFEWEKFFPTTVQELESEAMTNI